MANMTVNSYDTLKGLVFPCPFRVSAEKDTLFRVAGLSRKSSSSQPLSSSTFLLILWRRLQDYYLTTYVLDLLPRETQEQTFSLFFL